MRGMRIFYRNGESQIINTQDGEVSGTVHFEEGDVFIGMHFTLHAPDNKKPRRMGITILRANGTIH